MEVSNGNAHLHAYSDVANGRPAQQRVSRRRLATGTEPNNNVLTEKRAVGDPGHQWRTQAEDSKPLQRGLHRRFVPEVVWEPGILTGYRISHQPWSFYFRSLFWLHNESVNVWSHLVGVVVNISLVLSFTSDTDFGSDASSHGMLLFCVGSCATFLLSASAHLLHNKNERAHYTLFCLDYIGISLYAYTYGMMTYYSSGNREFYESPLGGVFPVLHAAMAVNQTIWCILARVLYKSEQCFGRKCLMVGPCALGVLSSEIPLLFRLYGELHAGFTNSIHLYHLVFSVTNGLTFALHQPENSFPGRFDHWGSGHQWFHLSSVLCAAFQLVACHTDLVLQPRAVLSLAQPNVVAMWGSLATVIAANMVIYGSLYPTLMKRNGLW